MTQSDIMSMAEQAGLCCDGTPDSWDTEAIERFAALVAANEREACAKLCEGLPSKHAEMNYMHEDACMSCAEAIRTRGEKP